MIRFFHFISLRVLLDEGTELPAASLVETAEHLIVLQTEHLDAHNQALHGADKQVSQHDDEPVDAAALSGASQHQHHLHHGRVAHRKGADTDEGEGVGEVAEHHLEELEKALDKEHHLAALDDGGLLLHQSG